MDKSKRIIWDNEYNFPERLTEECRENFMKMRGSYSRTPNEYQESRKNNWFPKNGTKVYLRNKEWEQREADYFYKWNNIAFAYDWKDIYHVSSGWTLFWPQHDLSEVWDYQSVFLIDKFES